MLFAEMTEKGEREVTLLAWFFLSLFFKTFSDPPLLGSSSHSQICCEQLLAPRPDGFRASCLTSHINLPSFLQISSDQISYFQGSGYKAPFSGIISN